MTTPAKTGELTAEEVARERARLGIPDVAVDNGDALRAWLRYQLQRTRNPDNKNRPFTQADIARMAHASEASVSIVYRGGRPEGYLGERIRLFTSKVLGIAYEILWPKRER